MKVNKMIALFAVITFGGSSIPVYAGELANPIPGQKPMPTKPATVSVNATPSGQPPASPTAGFDSPSSIKLIPSVAESANTQSKPKTPVDPLTLAQQAQEKRVAEAKAAAKAATEEANAKAVQMRADARKVAEAEKLKARADREDAIAKEHAAAVDAIYDEFNKKEGEAITEHDQSVEAAEKEYTAIMAKNPSNEEALAAVKVRDEKIAAAKEKLEKERKELIEKRTESLKKEALINTQKLNNIGNDLNALFQSIDEKLQKEFNRIDQWLKTELEKIAANLKNKIAMAEQKLKKP